MRLRAVVTYYESEGPEGPDLFVQDSTAGIWVDTPGMKLGLEAGQRVELNGFTAFADFAPQIIRPHIRVLGRASLPVPRRASFERLASTAEDSQWMEIEGIVRHAEVRNTYLVLEIAAAGGRLEARIPGFHLPVPARLVDARVRVRGACGAIFNQRNQMVGVRVYVPDLTQLRVIEPSPPDPFAIPIRSISSLLRFTPQGTPGHRVRVQGVVTLQGRDHSLFVTDETDSVSVRTLQAENFQPGDRVDVLGFPSVGNSSPSLADAIVRKIAKGTAPAPARVTASQALSGTYDDSLVQLEGRLVDDVLQGDGRILIIQSQDLFFDAYLEQSGPLRNLAALPRGSRLQVTGVCSVQADDKRQPRAFRLLLRSAADVVVLARPPWWTLRHALVGLGIMASLILAVLGWVVLLRRRVLDQTTTIREWGEREAALRARFHELFENANDMVFTCGLRGHVTSLNLAGERITGYSRPEAIGQNILEWVAPEYRLQIEQIIQSGVPQHGAAEIAILTKDGRRLPLEVSLRPIYSGQYPVGVQGIARDITERKRAEDSLKESEARFRTTFENAGMGIALVDMQGHPMQSNPALQKTIGYNADELRSMAFTEFTHPEDRDLDWGLFQELAEGKRNKYEIEKRYVRKDGQHVWGHLTVSLVRDSQGRPQYAVGMMQDITERKQAEEALRASEERFFKAFNASPEPMTISTLREGRYLDVNACYLRTMGRQREEVVGRTATELGFWVNPEARTRMLQALERDGSLRDFEITFAVKSGTERTGLVSADVIEVAGEPCLLAINKDITERKRAEEQLRKLSQAVEQSPSSVIITDTQGRIEYVNPQFTRLTGYPLEEVVGKKPSILKSGETSTESYRELWSTITSGHEWRGEFHNKKKNGELYWESASVTSIKNSAGAITHFLAVKEDITERKRAERVQAAAYRIAELANSTHRLEDFYRSTHELVNTLMPAKNFYIALFDAVADVLSFSYYVDEQDEAPPPRRPRRGFTEYILRTGKPLLAPPEVLQELVKAGEIESRGTQPRDRVGVPLRLSGEPIGVLVVQSYSGGIRYGEEEKNALQFISEQVAMAVSRKRAEEERHFLQIVTQAIGASEDLTSGLRATVQALCEATGWVLGQVWIPCADGSHLEVTPAWYGNAPGSQEFRIASEGLNLLPGEGVPGRAWSTKQRVWSQEGLFEDVTVRRSAASALGLKLGVAIPVPSEGKVLAVMEFFATKAQAQDQGILEVIAAVGGQLGTLMLRKQAEEALRQAHETLRTIIEASPAPMIVLDREGTVKSWNPSAERVLGWKEAEVLGQFPPLIPYDEFEKSHQIQQRIKQCESIVGVEIRPQRKDGTRLDAVLSVAPMLDGQANVIGSIGVFLDITDRKRAEAELRKAKEAAEAATRAKSEFLANMSHEIRTPMNGIMGMTELVLDTHLDAEQREYLEMVKSSSDSLLTVINDVLDFSKIEAGKLELDLIEFNLRDNLEQTIRALALRAHQKGLELTCEVRPGVPERIIGDPARLRQIVINLVGNAIKFTNQGEISVRVDLDSHLEDAVGLHFEVIDTGIGIPQEKLKVIFEAFAQADGSTTRKYGGTGLGLTISKQLVEMMRGHIWVESEVSRGSVFHFSAPFPLGRTTTPPQPTDSITLSDLPVLVVDDNATNRRILDDMLNRWRMKPTLASGGQAALEILRKARDNGEPFPLVLTDAHMPEMDGFALADCIRQDTKLAGAAIMMLTSGGQRGDAARCRELGVAAYLTKPIRQAELREAILTVLGVKPHAQRESGLVTRYSLRERRRGLRVLVAEDNAVNQQLVVRLLERRGHTVVVAFNGRQALEELEKSIFTGFDVVLMDIQMPEMGGYEATAAIREREKTTGDHLPIIAMTAHALKGDRERCLASGMDGYVSKPIQVEDFFAAIEAVVHAHPGSSSPELAQDILNKDTLLERVEGDVVLLGEMAAMFLQECPKHLSDIRQAIASCDSAALETSAHTLKGSVSNFTAHKVTQAALRLEMMGRDGDLTKSQPALLELENEIKRLKPVLEVFAKGV